jgi:uncharacterized glyoxalase superfamily protein PhnB
MEKSQNPFGLHSVTPYLIVENVNKLIDFLISVFDAELRGEIKYRDDKTIQHAEIKIGNSIIMMGEPSTDFPEILTMNSGMYVYVDDCDTVYKRALRNGGHLISEPMNYPHGDRYAGIKDFAGNIWWIVTHVGK